MPVPDRLLLRRATLIASSGIETSMSFLRGVTPASPCCVMQRALLGFEFLALQLPVIYQERANCEFRDVQIFAASSLASVE